MAKGSIGKQVAPLPSSAATLGERFMIPFPVVVKEAFAGAFIEGRLGRNDLQS